MRIFISWSNETSQKIALALRDWLPTVLPYCEPWVSSEDIDKGARWTAELGKELEQTQYGIICVVPGNLNSPWLNFEAGAISKSLEFGRVAPLLLNIGRDEIDGPLAQFQSAIFEADDFIRLLTSIDGSHSVPIGDKRVIRNFRNCWNALQTNIVAILAEEAPEPHEEHEQVTGFEPNESQQQILALLASREGTNFTSAQIARHIDSNETRTKYFLTELVKEDYVYDIYNLYEDTKYGIDDDGRAYFVRNNLV